MFPEYCCSSVATFEDVLLFFENLELAASAAVRLHKKTHKNQMHVFVAGIKFRVYLEYALSCDDVTRTYRCMCLLDAVWKHSKAMSIKGIVT